MRKSQLSSDGFGYWRRTALAQILWGQEAKAPKAWRDWLEAGDIGRLLRQAGKQLPASAQSKKSMLQQLSYFENNAAQMRYAEYREKKFFVGSGVVEAGCRAVIGERLKQSGMRWSVSGANAIIALRCCILSGRFEDFWASRTPYPLLLSRPPGLNISARNSRWRPR